MNKIINCLFFIVFLLLLSIGTRSTHLFATYFDQFNSTWVNPPIEKYKTGGQLWLIGSVQSRFNPHYPYIQLSSWSGDNKPLESIALAHGAANRFALFLNQDILSKNPAPDPEGVADQFSFKFTYHARQRGNSGSIYFDDIYTNPNGNYGGRTRYIKEKDSTDYEFSTDSHGKITQSWLSEWQKNYHSQMIAGSKSEPKSNLFKFTDFAPSKEKKNRRQIMTRVDLDYFYLHLPNSTKFLIYTYPNTTKINYTPFNVSTTTSHPEQSESLCQAIFDSQTIPKKDTNTSSSNRIPPFNFIFYSNYIAPITPDGIDGYWKRQFKTTTRAKTLPTGERDDLTHDGDDDRTSYIGTRFNIELAQPDTHPGRSSSIYVRVRYPSFFIFRGDRLLNQYGIHIFGFKCPESITYTVYRSHYDWEAGTPGYKNYNVAHLTNIMVRQKIIAGLPIYKYVFDSDAFTDERNIEADVDTLARPTNYINHKFVGKRTLWKVQRTLDYTGTSNDKTVNETTPTLSSVNGGTNTASDGYIDTGSFGSYPENTNLVKVYLSTHQFDEITPDTPDGTITYTPTYVDD